MINQTTLTRVARGWWLAIGGLWGSWVGFGGYFGVSRNADSFASLLASGFFIAFALLGLLAGMAVGGLAGWFVEHVMRRLGASTATTLVVATLASLCVVWQVSGLVRGRYPGLRTPVAHATPSAKAQPKSPCTSPAPSDPVARKSGVAECR
ncbi:MAG: hypothetical protein ABIQ36_13290 [Rhodanobacter sp.]